MTQAEKTLVASLLMLVAVPATAWPGGQSPWVFDLPKGGANCTSLISDPDDTRYDVSFEGDIRPLLEAACSGCHINGSAGGLNMSFSNARLNLIGNNETGAAAGGNNTRLRVRPFVPSDSVLFEKINCATQPSGGGSPMPPGGGADPLLQKYVHDWIAAGALMPNSPGGDRISVGNFETISRPSPAP